MVQTVDELLRVECLRKYYSVRRGQSQKLNEIVRAVDGVSFAIKQQETLGLVGESGSGKSTVGLTLLRLLEPTNGEIHYLRSDRVWVDVRRLSRRDLRSFWTDAGYIFQDPYSSLNPRKRVLQIVGEPLLAHGVRGNKLRDRVVELLELVGLHPEHTLLFPSSFSSGQRQRICIARALALKPRLIICDEPVSSLDVSIQAQILNLLMDIQSRMDLTYLFISHDLSVVEHISDRVAVMYMGKLVEMAKTDELYYYPAHPYTEALLAAIPCPDPLTNVRRTLLMGEVANPANPPTGCYFHPRCRYTIDMCRHETPTWQTVSQDHWASCHRVGSIELIGAQQIIRPGFN